MSRSAVKSGGKASQSWKQDPEGVRRDILDIAVSEFAARGLSGARIDDIVARTRTSKRMIYYYFGDKDGLYARALELAYSKVRRGEEELDLAGVPPADALAQLVGFTFDHHRANPDFIRMVMIENIHNAEFIRKSEVIRDLNVAAIDTLRHICVRGAERGHFRTDIDPVRLHWQISALTFFNVSNQPSFSALFGAELFTEPQQGTLRDEVIRMVVGSVQVTEKPTL